MKRVIILLLFVVVLFLSFIPVIIGKYQRVIPNDRYRDLTIVLDAGHGGKDGGASSPSGVVEDELVLAITKKVESHLRLQGINVVLTRDGDYDLASPEAKKRKVEDLNKRVEIMNSEENAIAVSIHANSVPNSKWKGAQTFYHPKQIENKQLATAIMGSMQLHLEGTTRDAKPISNIFVLKNSEVPTALVEIGFLSNPEEAALMDTENYQALIAYAIYEGILFYLDNPNMNVGE